MWHRIRLFMNTNKWNRARPSLSKNIKELIEIEDHGKKIKGKKVNYSITNSVRELINSLCVNGMLVKINII